MGPTSWFSAHIHLAFDDYLGCKGRESSKRLALTKSGYCWTAPLLVWNVGPEEEVIAIGGRGHALLEAGNGQQLFPRRVPSFFESFPVVLLDDLSVVQAQEVSMGVSLGSISGSRARWPSLLRVPRWLTHGSGTLSVTWSLRLSVSDGVLRTSPRGWFTFAHISFATLFLFGLW